MPRRSRVFIEGGIYHVYNRFARGAEIFREGDEAERFLGLLRKVRDRDGLTFFAWTLMSNHYHLALRTGAIPLSRTMGYVQARFGQSYNLRRKSSGPRWQSRYKARLVEDSGYFHQLIAYIHLNPVAAGLVEDPAAYSLSGHLELLGKKKSPLVSVDATLAEYGEGIRSARRAYVRTLRAEREEEWLGEQPGMLPWWKGGPDRPLEPPAPTAWIDELGRSTGLERPVLTASEFLARACAMLKVEPARVAGKSQDRDTSRIRYLIGALAIERWGVQAKDLGGLLGRRPEVVTRWAARGAESRLDSESFRADYERLDRMMAKDKTVKLDKWKKNAKVSGPGT